MIAMPSHLPHYNIFGTGFRLRAAITIACQCAFVLFGYDQGVFGGIVGNSDFLEQFGYPNSSLEGIIVSIYNLGAFSGCILAFIVCEKTGRRLAMWIAMLFIIIGAILQASAYTVPHLMIARYITGIGTGSQAYLPPCIDKLTLIRHRNFNSAHVSVRAVRGRKARPTGVI